MRFLAVVGALCTAAVAAEQDSNGKWAGTPPSSYQPEIAVVEANKTYTVKLECAGCPFALIQGDREVVWRQQENALVRSSRIFTLFRTSC